MELALYGVLAVVVGAQLVQLARASSRTTAESDAYSKVSERSRSTLRQVAEEVRGGIASSISLEANGENLSISPSLGFDGSAVIVGPKIFFGFDLAEGEKLNDTDDNGNGLVDEGRLVRVDGATGEKTVLCEGLDLTRCSFSRNGNAVVLQLTNMAFVRESGEVIRANRSLTMTPRN